LFVSVVDFVSVSPVVGAGGVVFADVLVDAGGDGCVGFVAVVSVRDGDDWHSPVGFVVPVAYAPPVALVCEAE